MGICVKFYEMMSLIAIANSVILLYSLILNVFYKEESSFVNVYMIEFEYVLARLLRMMQETLIEL